MGKYLEIESDFGEIHKELTSIDERLSLIDIVDSDTVINNVSKTIVDIKLKLLKLESEYRQHFAKELAEDIVKENGG